MRYQIEKVSDEIERVKVSYEDEGISLSGERLVKGDGLSQVSVLDADLRRNNIHLWPLPEPVPMEEEV